MDNFSALLGGFADALTPMNLLFALLGVIARHRRRRAARHRPGHDRRAAAADHLRVCPTSAFIMFAGIFYGGMYGGSTTSILLNTPGESVVGRHRHRGQQDGQGRPGRAGAGDGGHRLVHRRHDRHDAARPRSRPRCRDFAVTLGAPEYFAIMLLAFVAVTAVLGSSRLRGFAALLLGLTIGLVGTDFVTGQQRLTFGSPSSPTASTSSSSRWRSSPSARRCGWPRTCGASPPTSSRWAGRGWPRATGGGRGSPGCAAPRSASRSAPCPAGGAEIPTFLSYVTEKQALQAPRGVRQGRHRGRRRAGGGQQRLGRGHPGAAAGARPADQRHRGDHARGAR